MLGWIPILLRWIAFPNFTPDSYPTFARNSIRVLRQGKHIYNPENPPEPNSHATQKAQETQNLASAGMFFRAMAPEPLAKLLSELLQESLQESVFSSQNFVMHGPGIGSGAVHPES